MIDLEMVQIPGGTFTMGSPESEDESPQHKVTVPPFFIGKYPVTQVQWKAVAALPGVDQLLSPDPSHFKGDSRPVEQVSWDDAVEFCKRLSEHAGREYRLPSEAEWEYACRAGTTTPFHFGETLTSDLANYDTEQTTDVGRFPANAFGLYDMHGNVWEWCADHWHENYRGAPTGGSAWVSGGDASTCVLRGGSWDLNPRFCRSASRFRFDPDFSLSYFGFRVVREA